jgi:hypothetical protein
MTNAWLIDDELIAARDRTALLSDVLVAGGVDRRSVDRRLGGLDRARPHLAADGGGLVLRGSGLEQGPAHLAAGAALVMNPAARSPRPASAHSSCTSLT